jgi:hypothetical protein
MDADVFFIITVTTPALFSILKPVLMLLELFNELLDFLLIIFDMVHQPFVMLKLFAHRLDLILQSVFLLLITFYLLAHRVNLMLQLTELKAHYNNDTDEDCHNEALWLIEKVFDRVNWTFVIIVCLEAGLNSCFFHKIVLKG